MDSFNRLTTVFTFTVAVTQAQNAVQKDANVLGIQNAVRSWCCSMVSVATGRVGRRISVACRASFV